MGAFVNLLKDRSGVSAAEYALILAIIGAAVALAAGNLGSTISNAIGDAKTQIDSCGNQSSC